MSSQLHDDEIVARLRAGAPAYPDSGPDAGRMLTAARRGQRRRRHRRALVGLAAVVVTLAGLTAAGPIHVPGFGTFVMPGGYDLNSLLNQGEPPVLPRQQLLADVADLEREVRPVADELGLSLYIAEGMPGGRPECRVLTWSQGAFRDRDPDCANPDDPERPFDAASEAAYQRVSDAIERSGVGVYRIDKGGWGVGTAFHLQDSSWLWNWYYSYIPDTPADPPDELRTQTPLGTRLQVHVDGDWWFIVEPDD